MNARETTITRYEFDFTENWDWETLEIHAARAGGLDNLARLRELLSIEDARFLFSQLTQLDDPSKIRSLREYEQLQAEWGGSFHGMLPTPLGEQEPPIPVDFDSLISCAHILAQARLENLEALRKAIPAYPIGFKQGSFPKLQTAPYPAGWSFTLDLSAIERVLDLFGEAAAAHRTIEPTAAEIASLPAFTEMMRHRQELGYIPEPLITTDGLAAFLQHAASREPLDMLWKWLAPGNLFDLADLFMHQGHYKTLVATLDVHRDEIAGHILGTIARFAPKGTVFNDRLAFAVGWGIAGWATNATGGINIEHFKDDYDRLLLTLTHETFHRFQLQVCPSDPSVDAKERSFEAIASFPFALDLDRKFYEVLAYIFLEGTATFVAAAHPPVDREESIRQGTELLAQAFSAIYEDQDLDRAEEFLNKGLKSNGPFYWLGAHIAKSIVAKGGDASLAAALAAGAPAFFVAGFFSEPSVYLPLKEKIEGKTRELAALMMAA